MNQRSSRFFWHFLACLGFILLPLLLSPRPPKAPLFEPPAIRDFLANVLMLIIFYANFYLLIPQFYFRKKSILYAGLILIGLLLITVVPSLLTGYVPWDPPQPNATPENIPGPPRYVPSSFLGHVKHNIVLYAAVIMFSILLRIRMKLYETELLKHNAEIGSLKSQINPHFLFNTLNNIYAYAIKERSQTTASSILKLSSMMRYVVTETSHDFVPLEKEINYTNDYIDLQKMRLTESLHLTYRVIGNITTQKIAPVILMPFIENAFKHGVNPDKESNISIEITVQDAELELNIENEKVKTTPNLHTKSGIGIDNTRMRLDLLYPKKYTLLIDNGTNHYRVKLKLILQ